MKHQRITKHFLLCKLLISLLNFVTLACGMHVLKGIANSIMELVRASFAFTLDWHSTTISYIL